MYTPKWFSWVQDHFEHNVNKTSHIYPQKDFNPLEVK